MNMQKALQNLYKAITNEDNHKVNISKLLVDIHYGITGEMPTVKNNWSRIIDSLATNWPEGGSSDLTYANVKMNYSDAYTSVAFAQVHHYMNVMNGDNYAIVFDYDAGGEALPISDMGSVSSLKVPIWKDMSTSINNIFYDVDNSAMLINPSNTTVVSGDAEISNSYILISGDCELNVALVYAD